jgi:acetyl-CoA carboxylase carboxyl transferase subunit beta
MYINEIILMAGEDGLLKNLFNKPKYVTVAPVARQQGQEDTENIWTKCSQCSEIFYNKELDKNLKVCAKCNYHFRLGAWERIAVTADEDSFQEFNGHLISSNPLDFSGYEEKIKAEQDKTKLNEALVTGTALICGHPCILAVQDAHFFMGSMGTVVGEKLVLAIERAMEERLPLVVFSASGGARMQEGVLSLMQMAKASAALTRLGEAGLLFISVFTDPTTGGVTASYASLGDIIMAEPNALIGFAGPRVIEQTIRQKLPEGFQRSEFLLQHGLLDKVVARVELKATLAKILALHS